MIRRTPEIVVRQESSVKKKVRHLSLMKSYFSLLNETHSKLKSVEQVRQIYDELVQPEMKKDDELDGQLFRSQPVDAVTPTGKIVHKGVHPEQSIHNAI